MHTRKRTRWNSTSASHSVPRSRRSHGGRGSVGRPPQPSGKGESAHTLTTATAALQPRRPAGLPSRPVPTRPTRRPGTPAPQPDRGKSGPSCPKLAGTSRSARKARVGRAGPGRRGAGPGGGELAPRSHTGPVCRLGTPLRPVPPLPHLASAEGERSPAPRAARAGKTRPAAGGRAGAPGSGEGRGAEPSRRAARGAHLRAEVGALDAQLEAGRALQLGLAAAAGRLADAGLHRRHAAGLPQARRGAARRAAGEEPPPGGAAGRGQTGRRGPGGGRCAWRSSSPSPSASPPALRPFRADAGALGEPRPLGEAGAESGGRERERVTRPGERVTRPAGVR